MVAHRQERDHGPGGLEPVAFYGGVPGMRFPFVAPPSLAFLAPILYVAVDDIHEAARALESRGVAFEQPPHRVAELAHADLWLAAFRDMDGNILELMSEVPRA
jgi:catechol 2,3-dioxygenase-like lactoylglutathione lyase family enzyme